MFCKKCGKELSEGVAICPDCGTKQTEIPESKEKESNKNVISKIWNSSLFTKIAIKFGNVLEILEGIIFFILSILLFDEGGFWGIIFGILFVLAGIGNCIGGVKSLLSRKKNNSEAETLDEAAVNKKKRNLCIGVAAIVILLIIFGNTGGGTYSIVKSVTFDSMGSETIGEIVDKNIKSSEWSQKKLDGNSKLVYVEGYCPAYGETLKIEFYYEKLDDGSYEVTLNKMSFPDSNEEYSAFEASIAWASFYY